MTRLRLILRNLVYFRSANAAVIAGMAVATAVLTGALLVGDSMRTSLRNLASRRLGTVDHALVAPRFFDESLAERLEQAPGFAEEFRGVAGVISVRGGASYEEDGRKKRTGGVQVLAGALVPIGPNEATLGGELADALGVAGRGKLQLLLPIVSDTPLDAMLARRSMSERTARLAATPTAVSRELSFVPLFDLAPSQRAPLNAWVNLRKLQGQIEQPGKVNLLLAFTDESSGGAEGAARLNAMLREVVALADYGLRIETAGQGREAALVSESTYLAPEVERAALEAAAAIGAFPQRTTVYLVNRVEKLVGDSRPSMSIHYAIAAGVDRVEDRELGDDEVAVNQWTADRLGARVGDKLRLHYYERKGDGSLVEVTAGQDLHVAVILPMRGIGADSSMTPKFKGLTDADSVADWQPPEGFDLKRNLVTPEDEAYWDEHKAAPKLLMNLPTAKRLWGATFGAVTSVRVPVAHRDEFAEAVRQRIDPAAMGMAFMPVRAQQLEAASTGTSFSELFAALSFFLIASAVLLVAMLFRLGIERRARQYGLLSALGFAPRTLLRLAMVEGMALAAIGAAVGVALAVGYTALMLLGLRTWWIGAVGTTAIRLNATPPTLLIGFISSMAVAAGAITWGAWRVGKAQAAVLLAGGGSGEGRKRGHGGVRGGLIAIASAVTGFALIVLALRGNIPTEAASMGGGSLLLLAALIWAAKSLATDRRRIDRRWSITHLAMRNAGRHLGRSVMTMMLIALASFLLITVASMRQEPPAEPHKRPSGTGGFQLIMQADMPLLGDPGTTAGREILGMRDTTSPLWERARFRPLRTWAGQDASCLNLTRPTSPTIVALPRELAAQNAFALKRSTAPGDSDPWQPLWTPQPDGSIPVIADAETATYILKLSLGEHLEIIDQVGRPRRLKLVATLDHSIFQGELLMDEENFLRLFPSQSGFGIVLVESSAADLPELITRLAEELPDISVTIERTTDRLARYQAVANTYLSTFQTLGWLGLLLGTVGLAVVLLRNLVERRGELALLSAIGFAPSARLRLVLSENALLLAAGLAIGTLCALAGVIPALRRINLLQVTLMLGTVLLFGLGALLLATWLGARRVSPGDLRRE